ncbi:MAG: hypothetical protein GY856_45835 [bacterium]|nr:hypothetical protein [bacterium]
MKQLQITALLVGLMMVFGVAAWAYTIDDSIGSDENIKFNWTKDGQVYPGQWEFYHKCEGDAGWTRAIMFPGLVLDFRNMNPDQAGKACEFKFVSPSGATDWRQEIIGPNGSSDVYGGNIEKNSPWRFESLDALPRAYTRIPDLAPVAGDSTMTVYTAVNLGLYMTENPHGFLNGEWVPGETLSELGLEIVDGQIEGVEGIYWSMTPFEFDPDPDGPGFTPEGGPGALLNSNDFGYDLVIQQQHVDVSSTPATNEANSTDGADALGF